MLVCGRIVKFMFGGRVFKRGLHGRSEGSIVGRKLLISFDVNKLEKLRLHMLANEGTIDVHMLDAFMTYRIEFEICYRKMS
ncbi:hypothetical protein MTR_2g027895 [Medicago truncatula]|uniref:Uncharacterized protein n=1 Tax=Medicago truncatula TaxID=3880 RepID=A0A072V5A9_MEDTR|nr:hypothetical protein MTR_2g027895 [Medicago truncatula]